MRTIGSGCANQGKARQEYFRRAQTDKRSENGSRLDSMAHVDQLRHHVDQIHKINAVVCNVPQVLDSLDITVSSVPTIHLYLFELIQNALDAKADSIEIRLNAIAQTSVDTASADVLRAQSLVFLHNGPGGLGQNEKHVRGMSNVFQSTKSVGSVGFMGFGFKTLYKRFTQVFVSDSIGWKFKFEVPELLLSFHNFQGNNFVGTPINDLEDISLKSRSWIGAVCPEWSDHITAPDDAFTTRFELTSLVTATLNTSLYEDVQDALFSGGMTALAVLGSQGLRKLKIVDETNPTASRQFALDVADGSTTVTQTLPTPQSLSWTTLRCDFTPDAPATQALAQVRLKNILQHHTQLDTVISDIRKPYSVLGLVPLDEKDGLPREISGQLFATLPIRCFLPFGISIQADWLLDLSRKGLRDVETNLWQQAIVKQIAKLLATWLARISSLGDVERISRAFALFGCNSTSMNSIPFKMTSFGKWILEELGDKAIFPVLSSGNISSKNETPQKIEWKPANQVVLLPSTQHKPRGISNLIGLFAVDESLVSASACQFFVSIGLLKKLDVSDLISRFSGVGGVGDWYSSLDMSDPAKREFLVELWAFLAEFAPQSVISQLHCVPVISLDDKQCSSRSASSSAWHWISPTDVTVFEHGTQFVELPFEDEQALAFLSSSMSPDTKLFPPSFLNFLMQKSGDWHGPGRVAFEWLSRNWSKKSLKQASKRAFMNTAIPVSELSAGASVIDRFEASSAGNPPSGNQATRTGQEATSGREPTRLGALLAFTRWAFSSPPLFDLVTHLLPSISSDVVDGTVKPIDAALNVIGAPYIDAELALIHTRLFSKWQPINKIYSAISLPPGENWSALFAGLGAKGPLVLEEYVMKELGVYPSYIESRKLVADILEIAHETVADFQTTSRKGWKVIDTRIQDASLEGRPDIWPLLAAWLENNQRALERADANLLGHGEVWRIYVAHGKIGTATWCKELNNIPWVPVMAQAERVRPSQISKEFVALTPSLISNLEKKGVFFGRTSAQKATLDAISSFNAASNKYNDSDLNDFANHLLSLVHIDASQLSLVSRSLQSTILPVSLPTHSATVPFSRLVYTDPSEVSEVSKATFNYFLAPIDALPAQIRAALHTLVEAGVIALPQWPSHEQASSFFEHIANDTNSSSRTVKLLPFMFECLASEQAKTTHFLRHGADSLKLPVFNADGSTDGKWDTLNNLQASGSLGAMPQHLAGETPRVQNFIKRQLRLLQSKPGSK